MAGRRDEVSLADGARNRQTASVSRTLMGPCCPVTCFPVRPMSRRTTTGTRLMTVEFGGLGPVAALRAGQSVEMKSGKALELLAVLLLAPGHRASHASIMRYLWPGETSNANRIRQCFYHLRQSLPGISER